MIHGFAVALSPGVASPAATVRVPVRELHVNPWASGTKGIPTMSLGDSTVTGASTTLGLTLVATRSAPIAQTQAPAEIVLGNLEGAMLINVADGYGIVLTTAATFTGFGID